MYSASFLVLALAVFGASAQTLIGGGCGSSGLMSGLSSGLLSSGLSSGVSSGFLSSGLSSGVSSGLSLAGGLSSGMSSGMLSSGASTPVLESPTITLPGLITPSAVQDTCNCVQTVVKPTMRQEVYNIPSVQRFVQTTSTPIVESVPYVSGNSMDVPTTLQGASSLSLGSGLSLGSSLGSGLSLGSSLGSGLSLGSSLGSGLSLGSASFNAAPAMISAPSFISAPAVSAAPSFISAPAVSAAPSFISAPAVSAAPSFISAPAVSTQTVSIPTFSSSAERIVSGAQLF